MTNSYDSAYDELPECCCKGMEENEKLKRENAELRAMVNELRDAMSHAVRKLGGHLTLETALDKTPAQTLRDHDMRIAEKVREACAITVSGCHDHPKYAADIRNINFEELLNEKPTD